MQPNGGVQRGTNWGAIIGGCGCMTFLGLIGTIVLALGIIGFVGSQKVRAESKSIPAVTEQERLAKDTLMAFNGAVQKGDFTDFYGGISKTWQGQITPQRFKEVFQAFIDRHINIEPMLAGSPTWDKPAAIADDGRLQLAGHFLQDGVKANFELDYIPEGAQWKLLRIQVVVAPAG